MSTKKANLILTTCSMAWGTSYIFMKLGIEGLSPLMLMALRTGSMLWPSSTPYSLTHSIRARGPLS